MRTGNISNERTPAFIPIFFTLYMMAGLFCIKTPVEYVPKKKHSNVDRDVQSYQQARYLEETATSEEEVQNMVSIYLTLVEKDYYEVLDRLLDIFYYGLRDVIKPDDEMVNKLVKTKVSIMNAQDSLGYVHTVKFPDAISKSKVIKNLHIKFFEKKQKFTPKSDNQNTHDEGVTRTIRSVVEKLKELYGDNMPSVEETCKGLKDDISTWSIAELGYKELLARDKVTRTAETVLDKIASIPETIQMFSSMREIEIIALLYARLNDPVNKEHRMLIVENLVYDLADCISTDGMMYCAMGRISRLVQSFSVLDDLMYIRPKWAIRQELLNDASNLKERIVRALPQSAQNRLEQDDKFSDRFSEKFRKMLKDRFMAMYVKTSTLTEKELMDEVNQWIDYV
jgi:hypothetical protein